MNDARRLFPVSAESDSPARGDAAEAPSNARESGVTQMGDRDPRLGPQVDAARLFPKSLGQTDDDLPHDAIDRGQRESFTKAPEPADADDDPEAPGASPITVESLRAYGEERAGGTPLLDEGVTREIVAALPEGLRADQQEALVRAGERYAEASVEAAYEADAQAFAAMVKGWEVEVDERDWPTLEH